MSRKKRMQSLAEAKDRRMKKIAIGGAVLLVAVLAFEVPKMMHSSGGSSATPPAATTTATTAAAGAPTTTAAGAPTTATGAPATATSAPGTLGATALSATSTKLPNSDVQPPRSKSTLDSFSHFAGKDPFAQQISTATATASTTSTGTSSSSGSSSSSSSSSGSTAKSKPQTGRTLAATGAARIAVNGQIETVRVGASFPSSNPLFRLVGASHGSARIGIANGSYSSGAHTISLTPGRTLTLVDTSDNIRYKIRLLSAS